jgi:hypothetical protein
MQPSNRPFSVARISAGGAQLLVGPASSLFIEQMKVRSSTRPTSLAQPVHPPPAAPARAAELDGFAPEFTIINCPSFKADPERHGCRTTR